MSEPIESDCPMQEKYKQLLARNSDGGGLSPHSLGAWSVLFDAQKSMGITGNFLEIGLWTGIGLSGMALHAAENEEVVGVDLYVQREPIKANYEAITGRPFESITFLEQSSLTLRHSAALQPKRGSFRWVHIDGEHSFDAVCSDIEFAMDVIKPGGIIVIDDFFNIGSAGITEAVYFMTARYPHRLRMFLAGMNKAYLAAPRYFGKYRAYCIQHLAQRLEGEFGVPITIAKNGHSTEIDYISFFDRIGEYNGMRIGEFLRTIPSDFF